MLSKLLSNIANSDNASLPEGLSDNIKKGDSKKGSQKVFRSLLKAMQRDQSADNKQLLRLENSDEESVFTQVDTTDEAVVKEQQSVQSILERLQQQLKNESADTKESFDNGKQKIAEDRSAEASVGGSSNTKSNVDSEKNGLLQKEHENSEADDSNPNENKQMAEGSDETSESKENKSTRGQSESSAKKTNKTEVKTTAEPSSGKKMQTVNEQKTTDESVSGEKNEEGRTETRATSNSEQKVEILAGDEGKASDNSKQNQKVAQQSEKEQNDPKKESEQRVDTRKGREFKQLNVDQKEQGRASFSENRMDENLQRSGETSNKRAKAVATDRNEQNKQQSMNETAGEKSEKTELNARQKKVLNSFFRNDNTVALSNKGFEMKSATTEKDRRKGKENAENSEKGGSINKNRDQLLSRPGISDTENSKQAKPIDIQSIQGISTGDSQMSFEEQKIWDEHTAEDVEADDEKETKTSSSSSPFRLNQMPVANASLRQKMLPGLTQSVQKAAAEANKNPGNWKKHNFVLDDGKKIQLSVRESNGVLQVKMGSVNSDLGKLLQQNLQQIREHLKQEFDSDIDLQFEGHDQDEESAFSEGSNSSDQQRNYRNTVSGNEVPTEGTGDVASSTVRNFGYNQMEWTA